MCIVVYKPQGIDPVKKTTLKTCFENNSDGAGIMYVKNGKVHIHKGFMKFGQFWQAYTAHNFTKNDIVVCHFRIATAGKTCPGNCHPFPVSDKVDDLVATEIVCQKAVAHNGIIPYPNDENKDLSDTQLFVKNVLSDPAVDYRKKSIQNLIAMSIGSSKLLILHDSGLAELFGKWQIDKGVYYSNDSYKEQRWYDWRGYTTYGYSANTKNQETTEEDYYYQEDTCPFCETPNCLEIASGIWQCQYCGTVFDDVGNTLGDLQEDYEETPIY